MPNLPPKKVGIVACSGEELAEGTVTRLAALRVLDELRPHDTVTICLPLFLAGGEGDRAFARFYPTIAIDGCEVRCAGRATEMHSGKPAAGIVVRDVIIEERLGPPLGRRQLNDDGLRAVEATAERTALLVDRLLQKRWSRRTGAHAKDEVVTAEEETPQDAACACGSGAPVQTIQLGGEAVTLVALPLLLERFLQARRPPSPQTMSALMDDLRIYNPIPEETEAAICDVLAREYAALWGAREAQP